MDFDGRHQKPALRKIGNYGIGRDKFYAADSRNCNLDIYTMKAALKVSPSIVSLESYTGKEEELFQCTGTVMESHDNYSIILTSASLLRSLTIENSLAEDIKIVVHLPDGASINGQIEAFDLHFNVAAIRIDRPLPVASFTHVNDAMSVDLNELHLSLLHEEKQFHLSSHHPRSFNLIPGDLVVALGCFMEDPYDLMAAPGKFCIDLCHFHDDFNCKELLRATCKITRCGVGGPLINRYAEVIGICFYDASYTPFLPINVVTLWWKHYKKYRQACRPWLGMEATNLYTTNLEILGKVIRKFPSVVKGVLVEEVIPGSSADSAGIKRNDVIIKFDGREVQSFLELFEFIWHKVGESVELTVVRPSDDVPLCLTMVVEDATRDNLYRHFIMLLDNPPVRHAFQEQNLLFG